MVKLGPSNSLTVARSWILTVGAVNLWWQSSHEEGNLSVDMDRTG